MPALVPVLVDEERGGDRDEEQRAERDAARRGLEESAARHRPRAAGHVAEVEPRQTPDRDAGDEEEADEVRAQDVDDAAEVRRLPHQEGQRRADDEEDDADEQRPPAVAAEVCGGFKSVRGGGRFHPSASAPPSAATASACLPY